MTGQRQGHKKFVIVSSARSATTLLKETLATHPDVLIHGEVFHEKSEWHIHPEFASGHDITRRETDPVGFVREILDTPLGRKSVGFKMWRNQSEPACAYVLGDREVTKIILERTNRLAALSSGLLAEKTQVWNVRQTWRRGHPDAESLEYERGMLPKFVKYHDELFSYYRSHARGKVVDITYADVVRFDIPEVIEELDLKGFPFRLQLKKLHSANIIGRFAASSRELVRSDLSEVGHPEWEQEE